MKTSPLVLPLLAICLVAPSLSRADRVEPVQWEGNGHWYEVVYPAANWADAKEYAEGSNWMGMPGYLATITSEAENDYVHGLLNGVSWAWLGGYQDPGNDGGPEDGWTWVTGEPWSFTHWNPGEPNDPQGAEGALQFVGTSLGWGDTRSEWQNPSVIEYGAPAFGACCYPGDACVVDFEQRCLAQNGVFKGDQTTCDPNPCGNGVPILKYTWGRIRALFAE